MLTGHRPAMRRRTHARRAARIAVPLAIPVALGLTLGIVIAVSSSSHPTPIKQSALTVAPASSFANGPVATIPRCRNNMALSRRALPKNDTVRSPRQFVYVVQWPPARFHQRHIDADHIVVVRWTIRV